MKRVFLLTALIASLFTVSAQAVTNGPVTINGVTVYYTQGVRWFDVIDKFPLSNPNNAPLGPNSVGFNTPTILPGIPAGYKLSMPWIGLGDGGELAADFAKKWIAAGTYPNDAVQKPNLGGTSPAFVYATTNDGDIAFKVAPTDDSALTYIVSPEDTAYFYALVVEPISN